MDTTLNLIDDLARLRTEEAMHGVVAAAMHGALGANELFRLAEVLAGSGAIVNYSGGVTADLASTGGPGSLSTLLGPLYLRGRGLVVPKLGVPGRPAGGIDVLAQLRGYQFLLSGPEIRGVLARCGYAHFLADRDFAPLDAALFRYRQRVDAQNIPALAAASLLAKKIACGVKFAGLDVRVAPHGNFGGTFAEARNAARLFCASAKEAGIQAVAMLTDARSPYQPFIGRGEALLALKLIFDKRADAWLNEHADLCRLMAAHVASLADADRSDVSDFDVGKVFAENIEAQGSSLIAFDEMVDAIAKAPRHEITAPRDGFFALDIAAIRAVFVKANSAASTFSPFPDELGIILRAKPGAYIRKGDVLASIRADDVLWPSIGELLAQAFKAEDLLNCAPGLKETIRV